MRLAPIVERLDAKPTLGLVTIGGALEFAALKTVPGRLPAAFVVPDGEAVAGSDGTRVGAIDLRVVDTVSIVVIVGGGRGGASGAVDAIDILTGAIITRLLGWMHPDASTPMLYAGGDLLAVDGSAVTWRMRFTASRRIRKVA